MKNPQENPPPGSSAQNTFFAVVRMPSRPRLQTEVLRILLQTLFAFAGVACFGVLDEVRCSSLPLN